MNQREKDFLRKFLMDDKHKNLEDLKQKMLADGVKFVLPQMDYDKFYEDNKDDRESVKPVQAFLDDIENYLDAGDVVKGARLPFPFTQDKFGFRNGEVTMWSGYNSHGKSMLAGYCMLDILLQGEKVCIASFEMNAVQTILRMAKQMGRGRGEIYGQVADFLGHMQSKFYIFDRMGNVTPKRMYGVIMYCARELGVKHFMIDSLMRVVAGVDDHNGQKDFVVTICRLAVELDIHIHFVHHMRNGDESTVPNRYQATGTKAISDNIHNSLIVWRNKDNYKDMPPAVIRCDKQRSGEWEGRIPLDINPDYFGFTQQSFMDSNHVLNDDEMEI